MRPIDSCVGKTYGELRCLARTDQKNAGKHFIYQCQCSCGAIKFVQGNHLRSGHTVSCGHDKISRQRQFTLAQEPA